MGIGIGIVLLVIGLILALGAIDLPRASTMPSRRTPW